MGNSPLNVLFVTVPGAVGGLETVVVSLASGLALRGHRITVAATVPGGLPAHPFVDRLRAAGVTVVPTPEQYLAERRAIIGLASQVEAGTVHSHGYRSDVLLRSARAAVRRPIVTTVHGFTGGGLKNRFYERLQLRAFRGFDAVLPVSRLLGEQLVRSGVAPSRVHLIPNGIAPAGPVVAAAEARARLMPGRAGPGRVIGWVGRLGSEKACDLFIEALATIRDLEWTAVIIGAGPERAGLETLVRARHLQDRVVWTGAIPLAGEVFPAFDVFALSSHTEGTPMVVLEAMAAEVPVVATAVGGIPDLLDQGAAGWLVPAGDPTALGNSLRQALEDGSEARRRAARAQARVRETFSGDRWLDRHEAVYRSLLARPGPGSPLA